MSRLFVQAALVACLMVAFAGRAEARIFAPQAHWWSSGRTCVATREPPGLRWEAPAPRACLANANLAAPVGDIPLMKKPCKISLPSRRDAPAPAQPA